MQPAACNVLILGYGEMGHALQHLLRARHTLVAWDRTPREGSTSNDPLSLVSDCDVVFFCLPAQPHFDLITHLLPALSRHTLCISIAKGLDDQGRTPADVFSRTLGTNIPYGVLYGPMISEEMRAGRPCFAEVSASNDAALHKTIDLFRASNLHLETTTDRIDASWSAILKNVYAILFGVADELQLGDNMRGHLAVAALAEISAIVQGFGGLAATPYSWAGLGDLITTATSAGSHHHELGRWLARGRRDALRGEGIHTLQILRSRALVAINHYPLLTLIDACVGDPDNVRNKIQNYLGHLGETASASGPRVSTDRTKLV